jgi:hypothetical protein
MTGNMTTPENKSKSYVRRADDHTYNGWKNYETWNVALWIGNDAGLYSISKGHTSYRGFVKGMRDIMEDNGVVDLIYIETPDGVAWNDSGLDYDRLDEMIREDSEVI